MMTDPTNTVSLLTNCFFCDTLPVHPANPLEETSLQEPLSRELLDMPNVIPETEPEGADDYFRWDDVAG
jgi:hypothetical protein